MQRKIVTTADGSTTIYIVDWEEHYHSKHGAIQEAYHVFIRNGLALFADCTEELTILEIGFGTGLNALITYLEAEKHHLTIGYEGVEAYPVAPEELAQLNYTELLKAKDNAAVFNSIHGVSWGVPHRIAPHFTLKKRKQLFSQVEDQSHFNLIYFDAFGARVQPELWEEALLSAMFKALKPKGKLVTYAAKGAVRRLLQQIGFTVERLPGPPGKREMLRASKP